MLPFFTKGHATLQAQARLWAEENLFVGHGSEDLERTPGHWLSSWRGGLSEACRVEAVLRRSRAS